MSDEKPRRSRTAWPGPLSIAGVGEGHDHKLPEPLIKRVRSQGRAIFIIGACLVAIGVLLLLIIVERSAMRDAENERIRQTFCTVFDTLPEGGALDPARELLDCGPGVPIEDLPPEIRQRYQPAPAPAPMGSPAQPNPPTPAPFYPPADADPDRPVQSPSPTTPAPSPTPSGGVLGPVGEDVCERLGVCL